MEATSEIMSIKKEWDEDPEWKLRVGVERPILIAFTRHLSALLAGGVPLAKSLECLTRQDEAPNFGAVVYEVMGSVCAGSTLSASLRAFPRTFSSLYVDMVRTGESSGKLTEALDRLALWLERDDRTSRRVKQALTYPSLVLAASILLTLGLFYFVVPQFLAVAVQMGGTIPLPTRIVQGFSQLVRNPGAWVLALNALGAIYLSLRRRWATPQGRVQIFELLLQLPVLGRLLHFGSLARFCSAAQMCLSNGLTLIASLELAAQASASPVLQLDNRSLKEALTQGESLTHHLSSHADRYDRLLIDLVATAEEAARLDVVMDRAAAHYDEQVCYLVDTFGSVIEPVLLIGVGSLVGFILLSVFLPMYAVITNL